MAIKLNIPRRKRSASGGTHWFYRDPVIASGVALFLILVVGFGTFFSYYYVKYDRIIDQKFKGPVFANSAKLYAIPQAVRVGEKIDGYDIAAQLRHAGYLEKDGQSQMGTYHLSQSGIEIKPGPQSYHSQESAKIHFKEGKVDSISSGSSDLYAYELEPQLVTSLFDAEQRSKRQVVTYDQIPAVLRNAIGEQALALLRSFRKRSTVEQIGLGRGMRWKLANGA